MTKKELMIKAHKMTKEIKAQYPTVDYKFQLGLCLTYLQSEGVNKMVELKGSEKQVKWANDIREFCVNGIKATIESWEERLREKNNNFAKKRLSHCQEMLVKFEMEENAKYFIENFAWTLRCVKSYEISVEVQEECAKRHGSPRTSVEKLAGWDIFERTFERRKAYESEGLIYDYTL